MNDQIRANFTLNISRSRGKYLKGDGREYFLLWMELGTLDRISKHLANQGIVNPKTGKPINYQVIW